MHVDGCAVEEVFALVGVGLDVGLAECEFCVAVLEVLHVGLRAVARERGHLDAGVIGGMLGDDGAEGVVRAALAAGHEAKLARASLGAVRTGVAGLVVPARATCSDECHGGGAQTCGTEYKTSPGYRFHVTAPSDMHTYLISQQKYAFE